MVAACRCAGILSPSRWSNTTETPPGQRGRPPRTPLPATEERACRRRAWSRSAAAQRGLGSSVRGSPARARARSAYGEDRAGGSAGYPATRQAFAIAFLALPGAGCWNAMKPREERSLRRAIVRRNLIEEDLHQPHRHLHPACLSSSASDPSRSRAARGCATSRYRRPPTSTGRARPGGPEPLRTLNRNRRGKPLRIAFAARFVNSVIAAPSFRRQTSRGFHQTLGHSAFVYVSALLEPPTHRRQVSASRFASCRPPLVPVLSSSSSRAPGRRPCSAPFAPTPSSGRRQRLPPQEAAASRAKARIVRHRSAEARRDQA